MATSATATTDAVAVSRYTAAATAAACRRSQNMRTSMHRSGAVNV